MQRTKAALGSDVSKIAAQSCWPHTTLNHVTLLDTALGLVLSLHMLQFQKMSKALVHMIDCLSNNGFYSKCCDCLSVQIVCMS